MTLWNAEAAEMTTKVFGGPCLILGEWRVFGEAALLLLVAVVVGAMSSSVTTAS